MRSSCPPFWFGIAEMDVSQLAADTHGLFNEYPAARQIRPVSRIGTRLRIGFSSKMDGRSYTLRRKPVTELQREGVGARRAEGAAEVVPRREEPFPRELVGGREVPDREQRAAANILPPEHDGAAHRFPVEVRVVVERHRREDERLRLREAADAAVGALGDERR